MDAWSEKIMIVLGVAVTKNGRIFLSCGMFYQRRNIQEAFIITIDNSTENTSHFQIDTRISRKFDLLAFIFTLAIVIYHSDAELKQYYSSSTFQPAMSSVYGHLAGMAMSFFFLKTGYFLYLNADINNIGHKLKRRIKNVFVPFLIWNTAYFLGGLLIHGIKDSIGTVLYRYTFDPYDAPLWYLPAILALAFLAPLILLCKNSWIRIIIGIAVAGVSVAISGYGFLQKINEDILPELVVWIKRLCNYMPSYILGAFAGLRKLNPSTQKKGVRVFAAIVFIYLVCGWIITIIKSNCIFLNDIGVLSFFDGARMLQIPSGIQALLVTVSFWFLLGDDLCRHVPKYNQNLDFKNAPDHNTGSGRNHDSINDSKHDSASGLFAANNAFIIYAIHGLVIVIMSAIIRRLSGILLSDTDTFLNISHAMCMILPAFTTVCVLVLVSIIVIVLRRMKLEGVLRLISGGR